MPSSLNGIPYIIPTDAVSTAPATSMALAQYLNDALHNVAIDDVAGLRKLIEDLGAIPGTPTASQTSSILTRLNVLERETRRLSKPTAWTQTLLSPATGWTLPGAGIGSWAPIRASVRGSMLHINGAAYKAGGAAFTFGEHICTVDRSVRPANYWQFPRGAIDSGGKVFCGETGTGGWVAVCFSVPIG